MSRSRGILTGLVAVVVLTMLPAMGASAEPLPDGAYDVVVGDSTYVVEVVAGTPAVDDAEGVAFGFTFDEGTGRVLDEFTVTVDGVRYEVVVADDGPTLALPATETGQETGQADQVRAEDELADDGAEQLGREQDGTDSADGDQDGADEADGAADQDEVGDGGADRDEEGADDEAERAHGELVSRVARCAPRGRTAREAGLPNHGTFVRAAAQGTTVDFEVDGDAHRADLTTLAGAEEFCALAQDLVAGPAAQDETEDATDRPGRSGEAPGQVKKSEQRDAADRDTSDATDRDTSEDGPADDEGTDQTDGGRRDGDAPGRSGDAPGRNKDKQKDKD